MISNLNKLISQKLVITVSISVSFIASFISYYLGVMTAYNDATAHLNTARRMFDSLTPGFVQIGSVWLPLLHLLEFPFVINDYLFYSGIAGSIVSGASFVLASIFLYKLTFLFTKNKASSFISVLLFISNANLLYLQSTAMFEPLLMALVLGSVYYLSLWTLNSEIHNIILAALFTCLATLTRYDGWAYLIISTFYVGTISLLIKRKYKESPLIIYAFLAGFGIFLWLLYNFAIFGNALYFANSEFSAKAQQDILFNQGFLPTRHDFLLSFQTYSVSVVLNLGILSILLLLTGLFIFLKENYYKPEKWGPTLLLVPYFFNIISLYLGQSVIWTPMLEPYFDTYFNIRYGLLMLPASAFFAGYLSHKNVAFKIIIPIIIGLQFFLFLDPNKLPLFGHNVGIITRQDTVSSLNDKTIQLADYLNKKYRGGLILVSSASNDSLIFRSQIPLRNFITEGTGHYWHESLINPQDFAQWIIFFKDKTDRVGKNIYNNDNLHRFYQIEYQDQTYIVYHLKNFKIYNQQ